MHTARGGLGRFAAASGICAALPAVLLALLVGGAGAAEEGFVKSYSLVGIAPGGGAIDGREIAVCADYKSVLVATADGVEQFMRDDKYGELTQSTSAADNPHRERATAGYTRIKCYDDSLVYAVGPTELQPLRRDTTTGKLTADVPALMNIGYQNEPFEDIARCGSYMFTLRRLGGPGDSVVHDKSDPTAGSWPGGLGNMLGSCTTSRQCVLLDSWSVSHTSSSHSFGSAPTSYPMTPFQKSTTTFLSPSLSGVGSESPNLACYDTGSNNVMYVVVQQASRLDRFRFTNGAWDGSYQLVEYDRALPSQLGQSSINSMHSCGAQHLYLGVVDSTPTYSVAVVSMGGAATTAQGRLITATASSTGSTASVVLYDDDTGGAFSLRKAVVNGAVDFDQTVDGLTGARGSASAVSASTVVRQVYVLASSAIVLVAEWLRASAVETLALATPNSGTVTSTVKSPYAWDLLTAGMPSWMSVDVTTGAAGASVVVTFTLDSSGQSEGTYSYDVPFADDADNSVVPTTLAVSMTVASPKLQSIPSSGALSVTVPLEGAATASLSFWNDQTATVYMDYNLTLWDTENAALVGDEPKQLLGSLSPFGAGDNEVSVSITVTAPESAVEGDTFTVRCLLTTNDLNNLERMFTISATVGSSKTLLVVPGDISETLRGADKDSAASSTAATPKLVAVVNVGRVTITFTTRIDGGTSPWLAYTADGQTPQDIELAPGKYASLFLSFYHQFGSGGLRPDAPGTYERTLTVTAQYDQVFENGTVAIEFNALPGETSGAHSSLLWLEGATGFSDGTEITRADYTAREGDDAITTTVGLSLYFIVRERDVASNLQTSGAPAALTASWNGAAQTADEDSYTHRITVHAAGEATSDLAVSLAESSVIGSEWTIIAEKIKCEAGQVANAIGDKCVDCEGNTFSAAGASSCTPCDEGEKANAEHTSCTPCTAGTSQDPDSFECVACPVGRYAPNDGLFGDCLACPSGSVAGSPGATSCAWCAPGRFAENAQACKECSIGTASPGNETSCTACEPGYIASTTGVAECAACEAGTREVSRSLCSECSRGTYSPSPGSIECYACTPGSVAASPGLDECAVCDSGTHSNAAATECVSCAEGFVSLGNVTACERCPAGHIAATTGLSECTECTAGRYETDNRRCQDCDAGFFSTAGSDQCTECAVGSVTTKKGQPACTICSPGTYESGSRTACVSCPAGKFSAINGSTVCHDCPDGAVSAEGATVCSVCSPGEFAQQRTSCVQCSPGFFSPGNVTACEACQDGFAAPGSGTSECAECDAGSRSSDDKRQCVLCDAGTVSGAGSSECTACDPGTIAGTRGLSTCETCAPGTYEAGRTACVECDAGTIAANNASTQCVPCDIGEIAATKGLAECTPCTAGRYDSGLGTTCLQCDAGTISSAGSGECVACDPGYVAADKGLSECSACGPGSYEDGTRKACLPCDAGSFSAVNGSTACTACSPGEIAAIKGRVECVPCEAGTFDSGSGTTCLQCDEGTISADGADECTPCDPGYVATSKGLSVCTACEPGSYEKGDRKECITCAAGRATAEEGATVCPVCPDGSVAPDTGTETCTQCLAGTFARQRVECVSCDEGTFAEDDGAMTCSLCEPGSISGPGASTCAPCGAGTFARDGRVCVPCAAGQVSDGNVLRCTTCPAGHVAEEEGLSSCRPCGPGEYEQDRRVCVPCPVGRHASFNASASCTDCPAGAIAAAPGTVNCTACDAGSYALARSSCVTCGASTFSAPAALSCSKCEEGTVSGDGAAECEVCAAGTAEENNRDCDPCTVGRFSPVERSGSCDACPLGSRSLQRVGSTGCEVCEPGSAADADAGACELCALGRYSPGNITLPCPRCAPGWVADELGSTECRQCGIGEYARGGTECFACQPGTYSPGDVDFCLPCADGSVSTRSRATSCDVCSPGTYAQLRQQCVDCIVGKYSTGNVTECLPCPPGFVADEEGSVECRACAVGEFARGGIDCSPCLPGTYSAGNVDACLDCPDGSVTGQSRMTQCEVCPAGTRALRRQTCEPCEAGSFSLGNTTTCLPCPTGHVSPANSGTCEACEPGHATSDGRFCLPCDRGFYQPNASSTSCAPCAPGFVASNPGQPKCAQCAAGRFSRESIDCALCPAGRFSPGNLADECLACPTGYVAGASGSHECDVCGPGLYAQASTECIACAIGFYSPGSVDECQQCPTGTAASSPGSSECVECVAGKYSDGGRECRVCDAGHFTATARQMQCSRCPAGSVADSTTVQVGNESTAVGATSCQVCPPMWEANSKQSSCVQCGTNSVSKAGGRCSVCPDGTVKNTTTYECDTCPAGTQQISDVCVTCGGNSISAAGSNLCQFCPTGYKTNEQHTQCLPCPAGRRGNGADCELCVAGRYADTEANHVCFPCEDGLVAPTAGAEQCQRCPPGTVRASSSLCSPCPRGRFNNDANAEECQQCALGTVAALDGLSECSACPAGRFAGAGMTLSCSDCLEGEYSLDGAQECTACPEEGVQCGGGKLYFEHEYWRPEDEVALGPSAVGPSTIFHSCVPDPRADVHRCAVASNNGTVQCLEGTRGPLCAKCAENWGPDGQNGCTQCWEYWQSLLATASALTLLVGLLSVMVSRNTGEYKPHMAVWRILLNYLQANSSMGSFRARGPAAAAEFLSLSSAADGVSLNALFIVCAFDLTFYNSLFGYVLMPVLAVVIPYFIYFPRVWKLEAKIRRARQRSAGNVDAASSDEVRAASSKAKRLRNKFKNAVTILMFLLHNKVSKILFGVFDVYQKPIGDKYYIRGDLELEAFSINHSLGLVTACVGIAGYTLGVPLGFAWLLKKRRKKLTSITFRQKYGYIFNGYDGKRGWQWWESVVLLRKTAISALAVFVTDGFTQVYVASLLMSLALVVQVHVKPYDSGRLNRLETAQLAATLITQMGSVLFWRYPDSDPANEEFGFTLTLALIALNLLMVVIFAATFVVALRENYMTNRQNAQEVANRLAGLVGGGGPGRRGSVLQRVLKRKPPRRPESLDAIGAALQGPTSADAADEWLERTPSGRSLRTNPLFSAESSEKSVAKAAAKFRGKLGNRKDAKSASPGRVSFAPSMRNPSSGVELPPTFTGWRRAAAGTSSPRASMKGRAGGGRSPSAARSSRGVKSPLSGTRSPSGRLSRQPVAAAAAATSPTLGLRFAMPTVDVFAAARVRSKGRGAGSKRAPPGGGPAKGQK